MTNRYVCIHGHFYQPPRENPWLDYVELQDSAYPYHDWNKRITAECYATNSASRILSSEGKIVDIVSNYSKMSFNFGPTLLSWMKRHEPDIYDAVLEADRESMKRFSGHGSVIAQCYNHMIMPLALPRDKRTQILWGIKDFEFHFKRKPEGMWLPETAVDLETLELLSECGIAFTVLAPGQAHRVRKLEEKSRWRDVSGEHIDTTMPYVCRLPSGRAMILFFYDGPVSRDVAFSGILNSGEAFAKRLMHIFPNDAPDRPHLSHIATDGETYGHHHRFGDMALAYALNYIETNNLAALTVYGEFLEKYPPSYEVEIFENTSWSCAHGIERWRSNCGCCTGGHPSWTQGWRAPLRDAMNWLQDMLRHAYEKEMQPLCENPWELREHYIDVIHDRSAENVECFIHAHIQRGISVEQKIKLFKLLEMQHASMLMTTSCGWFFDEISGIETVQILQYAARAMQLAKETGGAEFEQEFLAMLERAPSNLPDIKNGAGAYKQFVKPAVVDLNRVGAHYAISSLFSEYPGVIKIHCYTATSEHYERMEAGLQKFAVGKARVRSDITLEEIYFCFAVLHLGDHNFIGGVREFTESAAFDSLRREMTSAFQKSSIPEIIRLLDKHFGAPSYSLWHLFKDEQRKVLELVWQDALEDIEVSFRQIFERHYRTAQALNEMKLPLPKSFAVIVEFILNAGLRKFPEGGNFDPDEFQMLVAEMKRWSVELDKPGLSFALSEKIEALMFMLQQDDENIKLLKTIETTLKSVAMLPLSLDLWKAQNIYFQIHKKISRRMQEKIQQGDADAAQRMTLFKALGEYLRMSVAP